MSIQSIPLAQLRASPRNVRRTGGQSVTALATSIAAHGLLQSLVVIPAGKDVFEVVAGGRRLAALQHLAKEGRLADDSVPCIVTPEAGADEASLAENTIREAMHPADQFEAFKALLDAGMSEDEVAARFSVTVLFVRQRLKLAKVSPKVLEAYRAGKFGLDCVEAFALSNDHATQERLLKGSNHVYAHGIRNVLTKGEVEANDNRVRAIGGLAAYEAAGGAVRRDLFDDRCDGYIADIKLLNDLVDAKLEERAKKVRAEGWAWVEVGRDLEPYRFPNAGEKPDKSKAGALVYLTYNGVEVVRGKLKQGQKAASGAGGAPKPARNPRELSFPALQALQAERTAVVRYELAQNPRVALAALAARLAGELGVLSTQPEDRQVRICTANLSNDRLPVSVRDVVKATPATMLLDAQVKAWKKRTDKGPASLFEWLLSQPEKTTHELLALCSALAVMGVDGVPTKVDAGLRFARLAGIDMAEHWSVSAAWLTKLPVAFIGAAVKEAHGKGAYDALMRCKGKAAIAAKAAQLLAPLAPGAAGPWLPAPLRTGATANAKPVKKPAKKTTT